MSCRYVRSGGCKSQIKMSAGLASPEASPLGLSAAFWLCPRTSVYLCVCVSGVSLSGHRCHHASPTRMASHLHLMTSQRPHLQSPPRWGLRLERPDSQGGHIRPERRRMAPSQTQLPGSFSISLCGPDRELQPLQAPAPPGAHGSQPQSGLRNRVSCSPRSLTPRR